MLPIDRHLRVVALLESLAAGLHDLALGIGEIALRLRLGLAVAPLVGPPVPRIAVLPRLAPGSRSRTALRRLQTRLWLPGSPTGASAALQLPSRGSSAPEMLRPNAHLLRRPPPPPSSAANHDLRLQANLLLASAHSSSPCACSRSLVPFVPSTEALPNRANVSISRATEHLSKQLAELPRIGIGTRTPAMLREVARNRRCIRNATPPPASQPRERERARRVGIDQPLTIIDGFRGVAPTVRTAHRTTSSREHQPRR